MRQTQEDATAQASPRRRTPRAGASNPPAQILLLARFLTLALIGVFASIAGHLELLSFTVFQRWWFLAIAVAALISWAQLSGPRRVRVAAPVVEVLAAFALVVAGGASAWPLVIYLMMTPVFVGIAVGGWVPLLVAAFQVVALVVLWLLDEGPWEDLPMEFLLRLSLVGVVLGAVTALVRRVAFRTMPRPSSYGQALMLLEELSELTRELPSGLGVDAVTADARSKLSEALGASRVALFTSRNDTWVVRSGAAEAEVLTKSRNFGEGLGRDLQTVGPVPRDRTNPWTDIERVRLLQLGSGGKTYALAALLFEARPSPSISSEQLRALASDIAAQIAAAEVYAEVRERATAEERKRVSREIHDGVAQDLAALTYRLDNIADETGLQPVEEAAEEVRRLVRELRLSIFDLRNDLGTNEALGSAIGQYAQQVASATGIVVHTTVSEHGSPLDAYIQHEMLRVCQEAVANARRHSRARNMWITYRSYGEGWLLRVADDGVGVADQSGSAGDGGQGLSIMRERVQRIGGTLAVRRRIGGGTVIEVLVGRGTS